MAQAKKDLVIVESPAKARTIEKYLGGDYKVIASMGHLRDLPKSKLGVDIVKIDGAFVHNLARSSDDRAFVQTLIDLARRLDIRTVAEWVQDEQSAAMLRDWGCDYIQGRLIGLASPARPWNVRAAIPAAN